MKKHSPTQDEVMAVYNMLFRQRFVDFYEGKFMDHLTGERVSCRDKEAYAQEKKEVLDELKEMLTCDLD